jgi:PAS domain S-box-containing protein
MDAAPEQPADRSTLRQLFDDYVRMYSSRDDRLTSQFSDDFSGFTGGGDILVKDKIAWIAITRQDFTQIKEPIRIELKDVSIQSLAETIAVATGFFSIHLPIEDHILSRETARLVLIFRKESTGWKISHSSISIPYHLVREGEVYPLKELTGRTHDLEKLVAERTAQLSEANERLKKTNSELAREIAERKQTAEALQKSEERYRSILHASPDDITITDLQGRIVMVSPAAFKIFGLERKEDYLGRSVTEYIIPEDRTRALSQLAQRLQGIKSGPTEYRGLRRDGSTFDIEVNSEFIRDPAGSPTGIVVISRDITERKCAEAERKKLEAQNRQLQKAESLGRLAGAVAHHFNNQLQSVMMSLEMAAADLPKNAEPNEYVVSAMQSARKAAEVSSLMLTYLGLTAAEKKPLDIAKVCAQSLPLFSAVMPKNVILRSDLPSPGPVICADPNRIQHVLTNLLTNAWESTGATYGTISLGVKTLSAAEIPATHRAPIDWQPQDTAYACLEIKDSGCGITAREIEQIFDPFYSTKFPGRGMGLAVVLGITRTLDGVITVESTPGRGSSFRIFLPVCR